MKRKRPLTIASLIIAIVLAQVLVPPVLATTKETPIGEDHDLTPLYYDGHLVAEEFAVDISQFLPIDTGWRLDAKTAFAVALGGGWKKEIEGGFPEYYIPYVKVMRVNVTGDSNYFPDPVDAGIVDNTGTGGNCTLGWELLLGILLDIMPTILYSLRQEPPSTSWDPHTHWIQANVYGYAPHVGQGILQTAGARFSSCWDTSGYHTLNVAAEAEIWVEREYCPGGESGGPYYQQIYVGTYSVSFLSDPVPVGVYDLTTRTYLTNGDPIFDVAVYIDGEHVGDSWWTEEVGYGTHIVKVESPFYQGDDYYRFQHWQDGDTSNPRTVEVTSDTTLRAYYDLNDPPNTPSQPSGTTSGYTGTSYSYSTSTTDPDGDDVYYLFDWGDGSTTTIGPYSSGATASASHWWSFAGTYNVKVKAKDVYEAWSDYSSSLTVIISSSSGCPTLFVWDGAEYVCEGLLDIHNPEGVDVVHEHTLVTMPQCVDGAYLMRLTEHPKTHSYIDQVKLYAVLEDGTMKELPLIYGWHSEDGNVLPQLLQSDEWKADTLGAEHNDGTSQSIDLKFAALSPNLEIVSFVFQIEGNNMLIK